MSADGRMLLVKVPELSLLPNSAAPTLEVVLVETAGQVPVHVAAFTFTVTIAAFPDVMVPRSQVTPEFRLAWPMTQLPAGAATALLTTSFDRSMCKSSV